MADPQPAPAPSRRAAADQRASAPAASANGRADGQAQLDLSRLPVPERPRLADGVKLAGQMQESAFVDPPWLLEREGAGYVQVTHLLYLIAEHADGQRTLQDLAREVSRKAGRGVSADNVRQLIATQLLPRGLVPLADGRVLTPPEGARSPLAVNMKMKMLPPQVVQPVADGLRLLYWPPVLVALLVVSAVAQGWMYLVHGVGGSIRDALYQPSLLLFVLLVIVLSAGFHELGHAAALHYGGGRVKGMGAGLYIVYPAFFTDVSDNYRLRRWARVRTDLGGFYFNLIFGLAVMGLYLATGQEFLLLVITLINLEIIHQLLPFVRLDGYWTLADLTGIPDFFSQMGAFIRGALPGKRWKRKGRRLPELKWWAKAVFAVYMLVTIPLLGFLLFTLVRSLPRVLATAVDAFGQQVAAFSQAQASGDGLGAAAAVAQMLFLSLPILGIAYTLYSLGRRLVVAAWRWSRPTPTRRLVGGLASAAVVGLLVVLWAPQLPWGQRQPGPLYAWSSAEFRPIERGERLTLVDAATGVVATVEPTPAATATTAASPTPAVTATVVPTPPAAPTLTPGPGAGAVAPGGTPTATPTPIPATPTPAAAAAAPTRAAAEPTAARPAAAEPTATRAPATATPPPPATPSPTPCPPTPTPTPTLAATPVGTPRATATPPACPSPAAGG